MRVWIEYGENGWLEMSKVPDKSEDGKKALSLTIFLEKEVFRIKSDLTKSFFTYLDLIASRKRTREHETLLER